MFGCLFWVCGWLVVDGLDCGWVVICLGWCRLECVSSFLVCYVLLRLLWVCCVFGGLVGDCVLMECL